MNLPLWARPRQSLLRKSIWDWGCLGLWPIYATKPCRSLNMTLDEVRSLLSLRESSAKDCAEVNALLHTHIEHVNHRIQDLSVLVAELQTIRASYRASQALSECGVLSRLMSGSTTSCGSPRPQRHIYGAH
ncbi:MerR family DNA-binding protein [Comamonas thiooxydans]|uniref:MerR family DNA-binding protein n=1 Tax=Comamonas thiooxydans TaxID=363952 RepID=UPI00325FCBBE